ncbi:MAG: glycosyltransferase family 9 protein [Alphaproteobacteria bacterium]
MLDATIHSMSVPTIDKSSFKTILIYTGMDTVGDGLVKLPFVRQLRRRFPGAHITWCAGIGPCSYAGTLAPLVTGLIDRVIENARIGTGVLQFLIPTRPLSGERFDLIIDTQRAMIRTLVLKRIRHGVFISGTSNDRFSDMAPVSSTSRPVNFVKGLIALLDRVAPETKDTAALPELGTDAARDTMAANLLPPGPDYVGFAPGAGDKAKIWPLDRFMTVASDQVEKGRVAVFFLGPNEETWIEQIKGRVPDALFPESGIQNDALGGPLLAIALAKRLKAAVSNDSGTGHMLAAGGVPLVSLFSKHNPAKYAPTVDRLAIVDSKDFGGVDPALIAVPTVIDALEHLLSGGTHFSTG